jgi:hypothetical protein
MRIDTLNQLYEAININDKLQDYTITLNSNTLQISNSSNYVIKITYDRGFFVVFFDNTYYYDVDAYDIEETIESFVEDNILIQDNQIAILSDKEAKKMIKRDSSVHIIKF